MGEVRQYLTWIAILCLVMAAFGVGIFVIGYQDPSFGRVATIVVLLWPPSRCSWRRSAWAREAEEAASAHGREKAQAEGCLELL